MKRFAWMFSGDQHLECCREAQIDKTEPGRVCIIDEVLLFHFRMYENLKV